MNQSVQFPDRETWDEARQCVIFPVMINGFLSDCEISAGYLKTRFGGESDADAAELFRLNRWDLEEEFTDCIENEDAGEPPYRLPCDR